MTKKTVNKFLKIGGRLIGEDFPPLVIAEIGINHGGSLDLAIAMVDLAIKSGAEIIKHQTHIVEDEMSTEAQKIIPVHTDKSIYEIMENCSLDEEDEIKLKNYVEKKGIIFLSTPFSRAAANRLNKMGVEAFKIGSGECNNIPLVEHVASFGKPMIISTGMNNINSIKKTVKVVRKYNIDYALLHCTNIYPTPPHLVRLGAITQLKEAFPDAIVGLSDHTTSNLACFSATALGASILERHFTDSMQREGPDIKNSMDPIELKNLILGSNEIFKMRGGNKNNIEEEVSTADFAFATVVSIKDIKKGDILTLDNIWVKRPGSGEIKAEFFNSLLGKKINTNIKKDKHLKYEQIEN